ncbi:MAG: TlpA disulfide reductase family protein [Muribaculaceae bacterium]|nr:TlpA disulfide reductase family protein [Muribaculaceae bacterium]
MKIYIISLAIFALALVSCGKSDNFTLSGTVTGADNSALLLQTSINGRWFTIDSTRTDGSGDFKLERKAPGFPEIYRILLGEKAIYFPIDSIESITLKTSKEVFGSDYTLEGSDDAVNMMKIDKKAQAISVHSGNVMQDVTKKEEFKRELVEQILAKPSSILAYYIINKQVNDEPLFSPENSMDLKIIGAVGNAYNTYKPNDPRTQYLVNIILDGQRKRRSAIANLDTVYASEAKIIDITLPDENGKMQDLGKCSSKGNVVVLNFTAYTSEQSPIFNKVLSDIYSAHKAQGLEIYQIGLDVDVAQWKMAAKNLPWITVYDEAGVKSENIVKYNVGAIPMTYIIGRDGALVTRVIDPSKIAEEVKKCL